MLNLLLSLPLLVTSGSQPATIVGATLTQAQETEFFTFFKFGETTRAIDSTGQGWVQFRPGGDHRDKVRLWIHLTAAGTIDQATLDLNRGFLGPQATQVFARDAAKSFLLAAVPEADQAAIQSLVTTIWQDREPNRFDPAVAGIDRDARVVAGYRAFLGYSERYHDVLSRAWITFENRVVDSEQVLRMSVGL